MLGKSENGQDEFPLAEVRPLGAALGAQVMLALIRYKKVKSTNSGLGHRPVPKTKQQPARNLTEGFCGTPRSCVQVNSD